LKICIVSLFDHRMKEMGFLTAANKKAYADRHGYGFRYYTCPLNPFLAGDGPGNSSWNKILAVQEVLPSYDWVLWSDADLLILNQDKELIEIIRPSTADFLIGRDSQPLINAGQFLIRNSANSHGFLADILNHTWVGQKGYHYWEQGAIQYLLEREWNGFADYRPIREFNSYANFLRRPEDLAWMKPDLYQPGDFICHFSGISFRENENNYDAVIEEMKRMLNL
jgi:hypothetical protein